jgi:hypothetical protein
MVNGGSRRSHDSKDELLGKPTSVGAYAGERLSLTGLGKALQGAKVKTGIGKSDFPGLQGGAGKRGPRWCRAPGFYPDSVEIAQLTP